MSGWRSVLIEGSCESGDVAKLRKAISFDPKTGENFHCLSTNAGIGGLPQWASEKIYAIGNLAERDYEPQDVADQCLELASLCPSLRLKVHCSFVDDDDRKCENTVTLALGRTQVGIAEIETIPEPPASQAMANLQRWLIMSGQG